MSTEAAEMNSKQQTMMYAGICLLMILFSVAGLVYGVMSGLIFARDALFTLDGILLALVCLTVIGVFKLLLIVMAFEQGWIKKPGKKSGDSPSAQ